LHYWPCGGRCRGQESCTPENGVAHNAMMRDL
jgi:hypothetical protein